MMYVCMLSMYVYSMYVCFMFEKPMRRYKGIKVTVVSILTE